MAYIHKQMPPTKSRANKRKAHTCMHFRVNAKINERDSEKIEILNIDGPKNNDSRPGNKRYKHYCGGS